MCVYLCAKASDEFPEFFTSAYVFVSLIIWHNKAQGYVILTSKLLFSTLSRYYKFSICPIFIENLALEIQ